MPLDYAPAFKAAVEEFSNMLGARLEGTHSNGKTQALTWAAIGLGRLRAATFKAVPKVNLFYDLP